jgi:hypothetical protein
MLDFNNAPLRARWPRLFAERREAVTAMLKRRALRWTMLDTRSEPESALPRVLGMDRRASDVIAVTA